MKHNVGDTVIIVANECHHLWDIGEKVIIDLAEPDRGNGSPDRYRGHAEDSLVTWYFYEQDCDYSVSYLPNGKLINND